MRARFSYVSRVIHQGGREEIVLIQGTSLEDACENAKFLYAKGQLIIVGIKAAEVSK